MAATQMLAAIIFSIKMDLNWIWEKSVLSSHSVLLAELSSKS